jgi:hypothetical protein
MSPVLKKTIMRAALAALGTFVMAFLREYPNEQKRFDEERSRLGVAGRG